MLIKILAKSIGLILSILYKAIYPVKATYNPFKVFINGTLIINRGKFTCNGKFHTRSGCLINIHGGEIIIGKNVSMSRNSSLNCHQKIIIGENTILGEGCKFFDHNHQVDNGRIRRVEYDTAPIIIGENTWIGTGCIILKGVNIGDNSIIAAGSIITKSVPSNTICVQKRSTSLSDLYE